MKNTLSNSNFRTCGARNARSFKFSMFSRSSRRSMLARDFNARLTEHYGVTSLCVCNLFLSGYRGISCFAEHSPGRVSDVFHVRPSVRFVTDRLRRLISNLAKGFVHDGLKNSVNRASISFGARTNE